MHDGFLITIYLKLKKLTSFTRRLICEVEEKIVNYNVCTHTRDGISRYQVLFQAESLGNNVSILNVNMLL